MSRATEVPGLTSAPNVTLFDGQRSGVYEANDETGAQLGFIIFTVTSITLAPDPDPEVPSLSTAGLLVMTALVGVSGFGLIGLATRRRFAKTH